ncbi:MAG TPA: regulatory protein RecX [Actinomycetota bacterium]|nr:regulatory protein RecX [Actinomycetota bacterium]
MSRASKSSRAFRGRDRGSTSNEDRKPSGTAKDRALRLLGVRWRSVGELRRRLALAGFPPDEVEVALTELEMAGLVDDERFARELVRDQVGRRMSGSRAIRAALRQKDVPTAVAEAALAEAGDDSDQARALARSRARRMSGLPPETAYRRLYGLLVRRGHSPGIAREACREALAPVFGHEEGPADLEP